MYKPVTISLTDDVLKMLKKQCAELHLTQSALIRLLILQNENTKTVGVQHGQ